MQPPQWRLSQKQKIHRHFPVLSTMALTERKHAISAMPTLAERKHATVYATDFSENRTPSVTSRTFPNSNELRRDRVIVRSVDPSVSPWRPRYQTGARTHAGTHTENFKRIGKQFADAQVFFSRLSVITRFIALFSAIIS